VEREELGNLVQGEAQFLGTPDEAKGLQVGFIVGAIAGSGARGLLKNPFSLVEANCLNIHGGFGGKLSDSHWHIVNPIVKCSLKEFGRKVLCDRDGETLSASERVYGFQ
jgi:hypothetical protein